MQDAARIADRAVTRRGTAALDSWTARLDRLLTSRWTGFPIMILLLAVVFWLTVEGANVPSAYDCLVPGRYGSSGAEDRHRRHWVRPWWLTGVLIDGVYLAGAWVVSVMLPPMMIFFPIFTLLEDFGYLPRVAFNLDALCTALRVRMENRRSR